MATDTMTLTSDRPWQASIPIGGSNGSPASSLNRFLGWFSIGLGVSEIAAPSMIVHRYLLMQRIANREIDPSFVVTQRLPLSEAPRGFRMFRDKEDECIKVVLKPEWRGHGHSEHTQQ